MDNLKWLHISDIHFEFGTEPCKKARDSIVAALKKRKLSHFDCIFITGDFSFKNQTYKEVTKFINDIQKAFCNSSKGNVYLVPGNHDLDRENVERTKILFDFNKDKTLKPFEFLYNKNFEEKDECKQLFNGFKKPCDGFETSGDDFTTLYKSIMKEDFKLENQNEVFKYDKSNIIKSNIICINTCLFSFEGDKKGNLEVDTMGIFNTLQKSQDRIDEKSLNIAIGHHDLDFLCERARREIIKDFENSGIDLYLCGHTHRTLHQVLDTKYGKTHLFCTGSLMGEDMIFSTGNFDFGTGECTIINYFWDSSDNNWKEKIIRVDNTVKTKFKYTINKFAKKRYSNSLDSMVNEFGMDKPKNKIFIDFHRIGEVAQRMKKNIHKKTQFVLSRRTDELKKNAFAIMRDYIYRKDRADNADPNINDVDILIIYFLCYVLDIYAYFETNCNEELEDITFEDFDGFFCNDDFKSICYEILDANMFSSNLINLPNGKKFHLDDDKYKVRDDGYEYRDGGNNVHVKTIATILRISNILSLNKDSEGIIIDGATNEISEKFCRAIHDFKYIEDAQLLVTEFNYDHIEAFDEYTIKDKDEISLYEFTLGVMQELAEDIRALNYSLSGVFSIKAVHLIINFTKDRKLGFNGTKKTVHTVDKDDFLNIRYKHNTKDNRNELYEIYSDCAPAYVQMKINEYNGK